ncbi:MAG: type II toxin-antitoxin system RelE family toxin [Pseudonocardiaceae bacterium]
MDTLRDTHRLQRRAQVGVADLTIAFYWPEWPAAATPVPGVAGPSAPPTPRVNPVTGSASCPTKAPLPVSDDPSGEVSGVRSWFACPSRWLNGSCNTLRPKSRHCRRQRRSCSHKRSPRRGRDRDRRRVATRLVGADDLWRIRTGDYRVVYAIENDHLVVIVVRVASRGKVYRDI